MGPRGADALEAGLAAAWPGLRLERVDEVDSTSSELMRRARAGRLQPVLLVARRQTAGRGRMGRVWRSAEGASLTFSMALPLAPADWSGLSLAVGVAVAESLHGAIALKWPNDLWWQRRKLGGILVETAGTGGGAGAARCAVIGIGLNLAPVEPAEAAATASLRELMPAADAQSTLERVAPPLAGAMAQFERDGFGPFASRFAARDGLRGCDVVVRDGARVVLEGRACGVDRRGALLVHTSSGMETVSSYEVSVRPVALGD